MKTVSRSSEGKPSGAGGRERPVSVGAAAVIEDLKDTGNNILISIGNDGETLLLDIRNDKESLGKVLIPSMAMGNIVQGLVYDQGVRSRANTVTDPTARSAPKPNPDPEIISLSDPEEGSK